MKRSEAVKIISNILQDNTGREKFLSDGDAEEILSRLEEEGMQPPYLEAWGSHWDDE